MPQRPQQYKPFPGRPPPSHTSRGTTTARGYGYRWQQLRLRVLAAEPLCRLCRAAGLTVAATDVDHIVPQCQGGTDDGSNLQPLCERCNGLKSVRDKSDRRAAGPN